MKKHIPSVRRPTCEPDLVINDACKFWFDDMLYHDFGGYYEMMEHDGKLMLHVNGEWQLVEEEYYHLESAQSVYDDYMAEKILLGEDDEA